jgi:hypothetical protein
VEQLALLDFLHEGALAVAVSNNDAGLVGQPCR